MIKSFHIKKCQSHRDTFLDFDKGVNVIIPEDTDNPSTIGKTSILRAFELFLNNRPLGARYFSNFENNDGSIDLECIFDDCQIRFERKVEIKTKKGKTKKALSTHYYIDKNEEFIHGKQVPDQVTSFANISDLNFHRQHEGPFLITSAPGLIAKTINRIIKSEKADDYISELTSKINSKTREIRIKENVIDQKRIELKKFKNIGSLSIQLKEIEKTEKEINALETKKEYVEKLVEQLNEADLILSQTNNINKSEQKIVEIKSLQDQLDIDLSNKEIIEQYFRLKDVLVYFDDAFAASNTIFSDIVLLEDNCDLLEDDQLLLNEYIDILEKFYRIDIQYEKTKKDYLKALKEYKKCPVCLHDIDNDTIERIELNL